MNTPCSPPLSPVSYKISLLLSIVVVVCQIRAFLELLLSKKNTLIRGSQVHCQSIDLWARSLSRNPKRAIVVEEPIHGEGSILFFLSFFLSFCLSFSSHNHPRQES